MYKRQGENPDPDAFTAVRGMDGWKEASFSIPTAGEVKVAVVSGLGNARKLLNAIERGEVSYDFVEVIDVYKRQSLRRRSPARA